MGPALACYFRKSWYLGKDRLPATGPVVVIANHAASFLDAMLMGVMLSRPIYFFARGDIFSKKWVRVVLRHLHMIPLFSADLAKDQLHRNANSFGQGEEILKDNGLLLIFPEGLSRLERNILPFRKGASRIILQTLASSPDMTIHVVPIGIHYRKHEVLSDVQLTTGTVVAVGKHYRELYTAHAAKAVNELTHELERSLKDVVLYVEQDNRSMVMERQLELFDDSCGAHFTYKDFADQKALCNRISAMEEHQAEALAAQQENYFRLLQKHQLNDEVVAGTRGVSLPFLVLALSSPIFLAGLINYPPYRFGKWMADTKVSRQDFYTSVLSAVSAFSYVIWLALFWAVALLTGNFVMVCIAVAMPLLGWLALGWWQRYTQWKVQRRFRQLPETEREKLLQLRASLLPAP